MNRIRQVFVNKPKKLSEFRLLERQKVDRSWKTIALMILIFPFGWIPAFIVIFPFALLFFWSIRKLSGY